MRVCGEKQAELGRVLMYDSGQGRGREAGTVQRSGTFRPPSQGGTGGAPYVVGPCDSQGGSVEPVVGSLLIIWVEFI